MDFNKNKLINEVLDHNFETWSHTLDTHNFVSEKYLSKMDNFIFENMKRQFKQADIYHLLHLRDQGYKLSFFQKLKIYFSGLRPLYESEKKAEELCKKENENADNVANADIDKQQSISLPNVADVPLLDNCESSEPTIS